MQKKKEEKKTQLDREKGKTTKFSVWRAKEFLLALPLLFHRYTYT